MNTEFYECLRFFFVAVNLHALILLIMKRVI
jgi:hypothetical protein